MNTDTMGILTFAYMGDAIYEVYVRKYLIQKGIAKVNDLQKEATKYVSAKGQCSFLTKLLENDFLLPEEGEIVYRARNHKVAHRPKSTDIITYKCATRLEALIAYLYIKENFETITQIMNELLGE